ncbi:hypothetical protein KOI35_42625 [Actinoplanes bogorensis]|uniref:Uncharacterized protein n=1 Tax=Paractinoplanes bogorensis TaxID=1610840 RepID=A0ABS5Z3K2_9ACTN|nr:hypothetical protein [Actinoplanes bogorensis]MBU2670217.1 hypothetical protein [Actinoplanes bogorensis]
MAAVLNADAKIGCGHGGSVRISAGQDKLVAGGAAVLIDGDLDGATVSGCGTTQSSSTSQCKSVSSVIGGTAAKLTAGGSKVLLETVSGLTDGVPPGTLVVQSAGQTILQAS